MVDQQGMMWRPMLVPWSALLAPSMVPQEACWNVPQSFDQMLPPSASSNCFAAPGWSGFGIPQANPTPPTLVPPAPSSTSAPMPAKPEVPPKPPLTESFDNGKYTVVWNADARSLTTNNRSMVSPLFHLFGCGYKIMILSKGNGFAKSRGMGELKMKLESDPLEGQCRLAFSAKVGNNVHGPIENDFSESATAAPEKAALHLLRAVPSASNTLPITLEVWQSDGLDMASNVPQNGTGLLQPGAAMREAGRAAPPPHHQQGGIVTGLSNDPILASSESRVGAATGEPRVSNSRQRSGAGQQRQQERRQRRLQARDARRQTTPS